MRFLLLALLALASVAPSAQPAAPDWDTRPALAAPPAFTPPAVERHALSNGLPVLFVEKPGVPLAQIDLLVRAGSADDGDQGGLASVTADLMDEGAGDLDALALADAIDFLGIDLGVGAGLHSLSVRLHTPLSKLDAALALMADVALRPTFPEADIERVRTSRLTALAQRRDEARSIAGVALARAVYGDDHPYGRLGTGEPATVGALTRDDLIAFHSRSVVPARSALVVVGATTWEEMRPRLEAAFGEAVWPATGVAPAAAGLSAVPIPAQVGPRAITFVDKPGAAQSVVRIGRVGAPRSTPDFYALEVLNTILGGSFTSRLNQNLREDKGYSYGARSVFEYRPVAGPFIAFADVQTDVTAPALTEFFRELDAIGAPVPADELAKARENRALSFPAPFATVRGTAAMVGDAWLDGLGDDAYAQYASGVRAVTAADLARVAAEYVDPERMAVVVVGDWSVVGESVEALGLGPVTVLSVEDVLGE
ncbi:M16 family metallopeptidase [Rubrivirga sp. IMCC43871]|uniref:M16 family metallopeptidase n=1 Tax=Rubrivirga sp. IMCC43871 TaxID=3391575 RepID=UPI00398FC717